MKPQTKSFPGLTGNQLKIIALIAMTCDHVGIELLPQFPILRIIGRLAAPIYAYMIAEGCRYTHDRKRYLGKLAALAAVCQIGYFLATGSVYQCILVTFSLSVCLIFTLEYAEKRKNTASLVLAALSVGVVCAVCVVLPKVLFHTDFALDYGLVGVMLPVLIYFGKDQREKLILLAMGTVLLGLQNGGIQWWGVLTVPLMALYNGTRGKWRIGGMFYLYYPLHLVVIYGISLLVR